MFFPFSIRYSNHLKKGVYNDQFNVMQYIKKYISEEKGEIIKINKSELTFKSIFFRNYSWGIMAPIEKGKFKLIRKSNKMILTYEFYMYRLFIIVFVVSAVAWAISNDIKIAIMCFVWLGGMNWLTALIRHKLMLLEIITGLNNLDKPKIELIDFK